MICKILLPLRLSIAITLFLSACGEVSSQKNVAKLSVPQNDASASVAALSANSSSSESQVGTFTNPILNGGYPDPSICRNGDNFYLVNSTFEYFPGLPIHHSTDLVNWTLVGYGLHRKEQASGSVNLVDVQSRGGIHAPSIRHHNGMYYIITTNVYSPIDETKPTQMINFLITADDPKGPWSMPYVIDGAPGIDPDIFFDDDGRVWYLGTHSPEDKTYAGEGEIYLHELDPATWQLKGDRHFLWRGALKKNVWAEGPHIYKVNGKYYLLVAEGGTSYNHAVTVAVSDQLTGPYTGNPRNPILTSRHLSYDNWVTATGHSDLVQLEDGRWYMVALGIRRDLEGFMPGIAHNMGSNMGRETHLMPVIWEQEVMPWKKKDERNVWPVVAPESGQVMREFPLPFNQRQRRNLSWNDNFDTARLKLDWNFRRVPKDNVYSLNERPGYLRLMIGPDQPLNRDRAHLMGVRQPESDFELITSMEFSPLRQKSGGSVEAGINMFQQDDNYISYTVLRVEDGYHLNLEYAEPGRWNEEGSNQIPARELRVLNRQPLKDYQGQIQLRIESSVDTYHYKYSLNDGFTWNYFTKSPANLILSRGYTGAYFGVYATSKGGDPEGFAEFDWIEYKAFER